MRHYLLSGICGLVASLAVAATGQAYQNALPPVSSGPIHPNLIGCLKPVEPADSNDLPSKTSPLGIDELLNKLEAIKTKKEALEQEEKEIRALVNERLKALQKRAEKLGVPEPQPVPGPTYSVPVAPGNPPAGTNPQQPVPQPSPLPLTSGTTVLPSRDCVSR